MTFHTPSENKTEEAAGETSETTRGEKQEGYIKLERRYAVEDWIHRAPKGEDRWGVRKSSINL